MSNITILEKTVIGGIATGVTFEIVYDYNSTNLKVYYSYYDIFGKLLLTNFMVLPRTTIPNLVENEINIELLWYLNKVTYTSSPKPEFTGPFKKTALPSIFRYELFGTYLRIYYTTSEGQSTSSYLLSMIDSISLADSFTATLGLTVTVPYVSILTEEALNLQTEDGKIILQENL